MKKGVLFVISGPSGVGKKTLIDKLMSYPNLKLSYSISMTTRLKRSQEVDGVDYFFVDHSSFVNNINNNEFLEYAHFCGNYYGTPKSYVNKQLEKGYNVILEIETIGARQVMSSNPDCVSIFIKPPCLQSLKERLIKRNTESTDKIDIRLKKAQEEISLSDNYTYTVVNDCIPDAVDRIKQIIINHTR